MGREMLYGLGGGGEGEGVGNVVMSWLELTRQVVVVDLFNAT